MTLAGCCLLLAQASAGAGAVLYNGIQLPDEWPPRAADYPDEPVTPPYLTSPPEIIPIDVGRQLFVDDFLIESTTLQRTFHTPEYHADNPVLKPDQELEMAAGRPFAAPYSDGVWFDPSDGLFKMWYSAWPAQRTLFATATDGIHWTKPKLDLVPGDGNAVERGRRDSGTVWLDQRETDPQQRFKMLYHGAGSFHAFRSPDGIHWTKVVEGVPWHGDRTTFFYNPFRQRWVISLRGAPVPKIVDGREIDGSRRGRVRSYWETADLFSLSADALKGRGVPGPVVWVGADNADWRRDDLRVQPELYNLDCVAYESVLLGLFSIWRGDYRQATRERKDGIDAPAEPDPRAVELGRLGRPKQNSLGVGFSRDGFHWDRPDRRAFLPVSEKAGDWNWGNVQSAGGCCLVVGDHLYFYVSGRAGKSLPGCTYVENGGSTGLALLRRDGFASMDAGDAEGALTTRAVRFGGKYLFVNATTGTGELRVEVLDRERQVIAPFRRENCVPLRADGTLQAVAWQGVSDLAPLAGRPVRFRFHLHRGSLYAFWVSPDASGASHGYVAAGGPGFSGDADTVGRPAYEAAKARMSGQAK
jgi:hypothetical protein